MGRKNVDLDVCDPVLREKILAALVKEKANRPLVQVRWYFMEIHVGIPAKIFKTEPTRDAADVQLRAQKYLNKHPNADVRCFTLLADE